MTFEGRNGKRKIVGRVAGQRIDPRSVRAVSEKSVCMCTVYKLCGDVGFGVRWRLLVLAFHRNKRLKGLAEVDFPKLRQQIAPFQSTSGSTSNSGKRSDVRVSGDVLDQLAQILRAVRSVQSMLVPPSSHPD